MLYIHTYLEFICLSIVYLDAQILFDDEYLQIDNFSLTHCDHLSSTKRSEVCVHCKSCIFIKSLSLGIFYLQESLNFQSVNNRW